MKDGTFPIFPYYKCHKPFLIHPNSPVGHMAYWFVLEDMVNCLWGYSWESLIPSPTQRTGVKEANGTMFSLLFELSYHVQGQVHCSSKFLAFVIAHCMCQISPFDGPFCLPCNVPGPGAMPLAMLGKGFSENLFQPGYVTLSLLQNGGRFIPFWQQQLVLPNGTR